MDRLQEHDLKGSSNHSDNYSSHSQDATSFTEYKAAIILWIVYSPCLLVLGGFGNIATILVMRRIKDHNSSQYTILMTLAVSDFFLLCIAVSREWVRHLFHVDLWTVHTVTCKLQWLVYAFSNTSSWLVTCVTVQRTMAVLWPHRMRMMWTVRRTWIVIAALAFVSFASYSHIALAMEMTTDNRCDAGVGMYGYFNRHIFTWVDMVSSSLLPSLCLLICDVILSSRLFQATTPSSVAAQAVPNVGGAAHTGDSRRKKASKTTLMILALSLAFFTLTMPVYGFYAFWYMDEDGHMMQSPRMIASLKLVSTVAHLLWFTSSAINFLLYCLIGSKYRRAFLALFPCRAHSAAFVGETGTLSSGGERSKQSGGTQLSTMS